MNMNSLLIALHLLSAVIWVGGMFFAYVCLRPVAATQLEPPVRLTLWVGTFGKFFPWVWASVILLPLTGYWMLFSLFGGFANAPIYIHLMNGIGIIMILIYLHVFFAPYRRLKQAVLLQDWPTGGQKLGQIRMLVGLNTLLGVITVAIASGGRYFG
ncbi:CopD family protein [Thiohalophilus thiocyanatoxydans]|uniref:Putative membrane protein n=1 Tax=Thiohalophilus thiocyanatoxydans TaxID=381308 RepID=A0A4R8J220_9GAMM|nr:CopD family protein [Thiohalophilus thiocyanatoxydans]TDY04249.1 putative membrane protein [Thiohalophilus thiocyanatoxydans]